jgi:hypothetical protein
MRLAEGTHLWCGRPVPCVARSGLEGESGGDDGREDKHDIPKEEEQCGRMWRRWCGGADWPAEGMALAGFFLGEMQEENRFGGKVRYIDKFKMTRKKGSSLLMACR